MATFNVENYRNVALIGHGGAGKTTLAEACLFKAGVTNRRGSVPDKTSCLDHTDEDPLAGLWLDSPVLWPVLWLTIRMLSATLGTFMWHLAGDVTDTRQAVLDALEQFKGGAALSEISFE